MNGADKVYPSANPSAVNGAAASFPASKPQPPYQRPPYRPPPPPKRRRDGRSCCCKCCLWTTFIIVLILLIVAVAGAVFYALYRPHRPSFTVTSLQLTRFNLTDTALTSAFNVSIGARNPNSKISFFYDDISVTVLSGGVDIGDGTFPAFSQGKKNVTALKSVITKSIDPTSAGIDVTSLKSSFKSRSLPIEIRLETKVKAKAGKIKTKKIGIRVTCYGIRVSVPTGNTTTSVTTTNMTCKVDPRVKVIKWHVTL